MMITKVFKPLPGQLLTIIFTLLVTAFLVRCGSEKKPKDILTKTEMAKALTELYVQEARAVLKGIPPDSVRTLLEQFQIFYAEKNNVNDSSVAASYQYYLEHPQDLNDIYDQVIDTLMLREQRLELKTGRP